MFTGAAQRAGTETGEVILERREQHEAMVGGVRAMGPQHRLDERGEERLIVTPIRESAGQRPCREHPRIEEL
jgi:hypothetical protein